MPSSLVLGSFILTASDGSTRVLAEGTSRGNPVPLDVAVKSWLQDGAIVVTRGYDNRDVHVRVRFFGTNLTALATLEASLFAELGKPNTLTWTPPNGPASVFDVITSSLEYDDSDDTGEGQSAPWRTYNLRLLCLPSARSASETVASALAATGTTTTLVNDGSATTNWTGSVSTGTLTGPTVVSGAVKVGTSAAVPTGDVTVSATLTTSISTSATPYLVVDWKPEPGGDRNLRAFGDGTELTRAAQANSPTSGYTRTWFGPVAASSIAALRLDSLTQFSMSGIRSLYVDNINRTDVKPALGSSKQLQRTITVAGSARTQGAIAIEHATTSLGDVLAYFWPDPVNDVTAPYSPSLRQYWVSGGTVTSQTTAVSGSREPLNGTTVTFDVPLVALYPGPHLLMWRMIPNGTATLTWTVSTRVNGTTLGTPVTGTVPIVDAGGPYVIYAGARVLLPPTDASSALTSTVVRVTLACSAGTGSNDFDEAWLFNTDIGQLTWVTCGTGTAASGGPANRVFIEPATVSTPRPTVSIGFAADRSDAYFPTTLKSWQMPQFPAGKVNAFTVTTNANDASVTLRHYPRWHSHAAS